MEKSELSKEEQLQILEDGLRSPFWQLYSSWLTQASFTAIGSALSEKQEQRDWMAGQAHGLKKALNYPIERTRDIKRLLVEQAKKN